MAWSIHPDAIAKTLSADAEGIERLRDAGLGIQENVSYTLSTGAPPAVVLAPSDLYAAEQEASILDSTAPDTEPPGRARSTHGDGRCSNGGSAAPSTPTSPSSTPAHSNGSTSSSAAPPVRGSASPASDSDSKTSALGSSGTSCACATTSDPNGRSGRTWRALCPPMTAWTSHRSWQPSWAQTFSFPEEDGRAQVWLPDRGAGASTASWMLNTSECPNGAVASSLSDVLEAHVHPRFYLSARAAAGILRRAEARGRELPVHLRTALESLARSAPAMSGSTATPNPSSSAPSPQGGEPEASTSIPQWPPTDTSSPSVATFSENSRQEIVENEIAMSLKTGGGKPGQSYPAMRIGSTVRRLTPTECERLMGWPDGWTWLP
jgi:hypothetical protein